MEGETSAEPSVPRGSDSPGTDALFEPLDAASLGLFRVAFGGILLYEVLHYLFDGLTRDLFIEPTFYFTFMGFGWVKPWGEVGMYVHFWVLALLAALIMLGIFYRVAITLFFLGFTYVFLLDKTYYLNHFYLVCLLSFLLMFVPADRAFSLRRWLRPKETPCTLPAWGLWALRAQIAIAYFYSGVAKINGDWLRGEPMRSMAEAGEGILSPGFVEWARNEVFVYVGSYGALLLDLLVVPLLLWRKTRLFALAAAIAFHLGNAFVLRLPIGIFPWYMIAATTLFLEPDWPRTLAAWWRRKRGTHTEHSPDEPRVAAPAPAPASPRARRLVLTLGAIYLAIQVLVPLRHHLYPGDPSWTNEGNDFAWRMMIFSRDHKTRFYATDPEQKRTWEVDPADYLTWYQSHIMPLRPDMIQQFSQHVAEELRAKGQKRIEVRAYIKMGLNGRRRQMYVDPRVDLAAEPRTLGHKSWIKPLIVPFEETEPEDPNPEQRSAWANFDVGAWILADEVLTVAGKSATFRRKRQIEMKDGVRTIVTTATTKTPLTGGEIVLPPTPGATPEVLDMKAVGTETEALELDGKQVECTVTTYAMVNDDDPWQGRLMLWRSDAVEVPYREVPDVQPRLLQRISLMPDVLRMKYVVIDEMSQREGVYEVQVDATNVELQVGERMLTCVHETARIARRSKGGQVLAHMERWLSPEVPNHIVKAVVHVVQPNRKTDWEFRVVDFGR